MDAPSFLSEHCLRALDAAPVGLIVADAREAQRLIVFANQECETVTGFAATDLIGRSLRVLYGADGDGGAALDRALAAGEAMTVELTGTRKTGEAYRLRLMARPVAGGGNVGVFVVTLMDITARHLAEERAGHSEARLRALTEAIPLPMLTLRPDGVILRANPAAEETLGIPPGGLPGRRVEDFAAEPEITPESMCKRILTQDSVQRVETQARRPDGRTLWILASSRRFEVTGEARVVLVFQDVTQIKLREQRLTEANEEAERNIRARMRFLAAASHDLRQPLQAMALFASALDHHITTPVGATIVQSLKTALRGMEEMFDSLLDMSKLDAGVMKSEPQVFLVNDIFEQLEATYGPQAEAAGLELRVVPSSAAVRSDPRLLARILGNFLSNAIRYTRHGRVLLGVRRRGGRLRISVSDTGPGIAESQRLDIFREFRQGSTPAMPGRNEGIGLGLAIVQRLARLLGHALDVRSTVGHGSTFAVEVPLAEDSLLGPEPEDDDENPVELAGATVAVVDDDPDIQNALTLLLGEWGCQPVVAPSADEALAQLEAQGRKPDVILADLRLRQDQSGIDAVAALRGHFGAPIPALLFSGDTGAVGDLSAQPGLRILRKPLDPMRLRQLLGEALESGL